MTDSADGDCRQKEVELCPLGDANGELGMELGCVISMLSRWLSNALLCGGDISTSLLTVKEIKIWKKISHSSDNKNLIFAFSITFLTVDPVRLREWHVGRLGIPFHLRNFGIEIRHGHYLIKNLKLSIFCELKENR